MDNNGKLIWVGVAGLALVISLAAATAAYVNKSSQLTMMENRVNESDKQALQLQTKLDALERKLEGKEREIQDLESRNSQSELERERAAVKTRELRGNVATVGKCLKGTLGLILAARNDDYGQMRAILGSMEEPCNRSGKILDNLEKVDSEMTRF